jgi:hypothetical protein
MRERGRYQLQLMKTRSSSGVGQKIDLEFNIDTLRITDPGEDGQTEPDVTSRAGTILNNLQRTTSIINNNDPTVGSSIKKNVVVETSKLRQLLNNLEESV